MRLYLDDIRNPPPGDWVVARNYEEFVEVLRKHSDEIELISFDHDLALIHYDPMSATESFSYLEKTGYDCALYSIELYSRLEIPHPKVMIHSMNPVGAAKIRALFTK